MTTNSLTLVDRYVAAAVRGVPQAQRVDVAAELRASVCDAIEDLMHRGVPAREAETQALTELGDPSALAEQYGGRPLHLIGPAYYAEYLRLLRLLLAIVMPAVGVVMLVVQGMVGVSPGRVVLSSLGVVFQVGVQLAFWVTLVFALLDRYGAGANTSTWTPENLPEAVDRRIGLSDTVVSIAALTLLIWAIVWQRDHWLITSTDGAEVSALDPALWSFWMPVLLGLLAASVVLEIVKYRTGRWTVALAAVNTVLNLTFAGIVVWLWTTDALINPEVVAVLPEGVPTLLGALPWIVVVIALVDTAAGWWNLIRGDVVSAD